MFVVWKKMEKTIDQASVVTVQAIVVRKKIEVILVILKVFSHFHLILLLVGIFYTASYSSL